MLKRCCTMLPLFGRSFHLSESHREHSRESHELISCTPKNTPLAGCPWLVRFAGKISAAMECGCARWPFPSDVGGMNGVPLKMMRRGTLPPSAVTARQSVNRSFSFPAGKTK